MDARITVAEAALATPQASAETGVFAARRTRWRDPAMGKLGAEGPTNVSKVMFNFLQFAIKFSIQ